MTNFSIQNVISIPLTATATSQKIPLETTGKEDIMIINLDLSNIVFVRAGVENVEADAFAMPILPGEKGVYSKGQDQHATNTLAFFVVSGTADIIVIQGIGE